MNGDGVILRSFDGLASVTVSGHSTFEVMQPRELYSRTITRLTGSSDKPSFVTNMFGDDYFETFFIWDVDSYFIRSYCFNNYYIIMVMKTPVNRPELMKRMREDIDIQLNYR